MITKEQCDIKLENDVVVKVSIPYSIFWKEVNDIKGDAYDVMDIISKEYNCDIVQWGGDNIFFLKNVA